MRFYLRNRELKQSTFLKTLILQLCLFFQLLTLRGRCPNFMNPILKIPSLPLVSTESQLPLNACRRLPVWLKPSTDPRKGYKIRRLRQFKIHKDTLCVFVTHFMFLFRGTSVHRTGKIFPTIFENFIVDLMAAGGLFQNFEEDFRTSKK